MLGEVFKREVQGREAVCIEVVVAESIAFSLRTLSVVSPSIEFDGDTRGPVERVGSTVAPRDDHWRLPLECNKIWADEHFGFREHLQGRRGPVLEVRE